MTYQQETPFTFVAEQFRVAVVPSARDAELASNSALEELF